MRVFAACSHGVGDIAAGELQELGFKTGAVHEAGVEIADAGPAEIIRLNLCARTIFRVYIRLAETDVRTLDDITAFCSSIPFSDWFDAGQPFAIRGRREGDHGFTSMDVARDVGSAVIEHFERVKGKRIPVNLDEPEIEIHANLKGSRLEILLNTSGRSLDYRYHRPFQHFAPLKPSICAALLRLSSYTEYGNLLDPMAGGGTIPIEAVLRALNIAPGIYRNRDEYLFHHLRFIDRAILDSEIKKAEARVLGNPQIRVMAADRFVKNVEGMKLNAAQFGMQSHIQIKQGLAETLSYIEKGEYDCIATNPPFGMRIGSTRLTEQLYRNFAKACADKQIREVVGLTPLKRTWISSFMQNGYAITHSRIVHFGNLHVTFLKASLQ
ncbi:MAG: RNA methyltransferase [Balneolaceae bacterium]|nr:MAG: RNA methyltransferase [Balneolaceae bacterium]